MGGFCPPPGALGFSLWYSGHNWNPPLAHAMEGTQGGKGHTDEGERTKEADNVDRNGVPDDFDDRIARAVAKALQNMHAGHQDKGKGRTGGWRKG